MTATPIHITPHHLHLSAALRNFVAKKIAAVTRIAGDIISADVVLRRRSGHKVRFSASARLALPGRDIHGQATCLNLYTAIGRLAATLARRARKRKARRARVFKNSPMARARHENPMEHSGWLPRMDLNHE